MNTAIANNEPVTIESTAIVSTPTRLIEMAIDKGADIDKLEKLRNMQIRWEENEAKKLHTQALAKFQSLCPMIKKQKQGHNYKYAPMSDVISQIRGALKECGLAYRFEQNENEGIQITCVVTHVAGHSERNTMKANPDTSGSKNIIQAIGSTVTYLQRYTLLGALGISTADEDIDGRLGTEIDFEQLYTDVLQHISCARDYFDEITNIKTLMANDDHVAAKQEFISLDQNIQKLLWKAPTKGGIFTTEELKSLKETSANG